MTDRFFITDPELGEMEVIPEDATDAEKEEIEKRNNERIKAARETTA